MRIFLHDYGGYPFIAHLTRRLAQMGHAVAYVCPKNSMFLCADRPLCSEPALSIRPIRCVVDKGLSVRRMFNEAAFGRRVADELRTFNPDIVVSANTPLETQRVIERCCLARTIPFVYWLQDLHGPAIRSVLQGKLGMLGSWLSAYFRRMEISMLRKSDAVIAISDEFASFLVAHGVSKHRIHLLRNWAPLEETPRLEKNNWWAKRHGFSTKKVLMYTGTLGYKHDIQMFLDFARSFESETNIVIAVISWGKKAEELVSAARTKRLNNLVVLPRQAYENLPSVLASADVLLSALTSQASAYSVPSKVLTYLCAGRALLLVMPESNPAARIVRESNSGIVVAPESQEFVPAARHLLHNDGEAKVHGDNARSYAETAFNIRSIADRFECILRNCLAR